MIFYGEKLVISSGVTRYVFVNYLWLRDVKGSGDHDGNMRGSSGLPNSVPITLPFVLKFYFVY
ncbi:hypothetical protein Echvi_2302 [Echinicola vietnamensis DSM 17526]|uniref:Uncharacterized protein n=1 Tax=Echinicola vietnamensis (strain DSM 17526 / LMG 23754 / KMM 6221) TaxID=926556 RepID=L0G149_ECHVK|nr:hypothetical protein Echvi_2302 [Echinicola vietnamensis DSM 17526]